MIITHMDSVAVKVVKLLDLLGRNGAVLSSNITETNPRQTITAELRASRSFACDTIHEFPRLSRFLVKENYVVVAIGFITRKLN